MHNLPPIAVTCGDPSGIGLEVTIAAWEALKDHVPFFLIADPRHLPKDCAYELIDGPEGVTHCAALPVLPHPFAAVAAPGTPAAQNAQGVVDVIKRGTELVLAGAASALCTAPISKKELVDHANFGFPGHTEFLAHLADIDVPVMMLASDALKVVPVTIHIPLRQVPQALTPELLKTTIRKTHAAMIQDFGIAKPRIAVAGLNPHAGEGGMLGDEDIDIIAPVCDELRAEGMAITAPLPADTMFHASARAQYDVAITMYHDQGLIPIKTLAFDEGVNVTLGLPFIRTSPDHGTAFDIAGQGIANPSSMIEALKLAWKMAQNRQAAR